MVTEAWIERRRALQTVIAALAGGLVVRPRALDAGQAPRPGGVPSPRATFVETRDRTRITFRDWGGGRPIVFIAPWALSSDWWDLHMTTLAGQGWRCVSIDRRGHGRSDEPGRGYDFDTLADDLAAVLDALDLQNVVLVGHSFGAAEIVRYLTRHRARRVARAVLIAPTTPFVMKTDDNPDGAPKELLERGCEALKKEFHQRIADAAPDFFGTAKNHVSPAAIDWWTRAIVDRCSLKVLLDLHKAMTETDFRAELRTIGTPTLVVHGDIDTSSSLELAGRRTHQLIAGSRFVVYEGAAHALPFTHAERLIADIVAFARE